ncbi:MAG: glycoside hydrolase family 127 protein, partial [Phycisphaerales bacterium]
GIEKRWTNEMWDHESYCIGHLIEAGVAHFEATGKRSLLDVAIKAADHVASVFNEKGVTEVSGHEEIELALIRLWRATKEERFLKLATFFVENRGKEHRRIDGTVTPPWGEYAQDHLPVREQFAAAGHAVRAGYLYSAVADLALITGDAGYTRAMDKLWEDITQRRIFITGGIGPSGHNEGFTEPYDIPTLSAYQETCASLAQCFWAHRMFLLHGDAQYMEQFETTLYNAALAGVSLGGDKFFYVNPLVSKGGHQRQEWFGCACCPPNVLRFFASLGGYAYATSGDRVYVNLFFPGRANIPFGDATVKIEQFNDYPWSAGLNFKVSSPRDFTMMVRVPSWSTTMDGKPIDRAKLVEGYAPIAVKAGDSTISLTFDVPVRRMYADPRVKAAAGRVALMRGPLVYCMEESDNPSGVQRVVVPPTAQIGTTQPANLPLLGRAVLLTVDGQFATPAAPGLYRSAARKAPTLLTAIPYYMWANREPAGMQVWLPESEQFIPPGPLPGVKVSASFVGHSDSIDAVCDRVEPASSGDHDVPRFTFWPHKGTEEWLEYEFDAARAVGSAAVYWFDDTGVGECRIPQGCGLEFDGGDGEWKPVLGADGAPVRIGVEKDRFNEVNFPPIKAKGLRIRVQLPEGMSTGVLEWTFGG